MHDFKDTIIHDQRETIKRLQAELVERSVFEEKLLNKLLGEDKETELNKAIREFHDAASILRYLGSVDSPMEDYVERQREFDEFMRLDEDERKEE